MGRKKKKREKEKESGRGEREGALTRFQEMGAIRKKIAQPVLHIIYKPRWDLMSVFPSRRGIERRCRNAARHDGKREEERKRERTTKVL